MRLLWRYFVAYSHRHGTGCCDYLLNQRLSKAGVINKLAKDIQKSESICNVVITNWKFLGFRLRFK